MFAEFALVSNLGLLKLPFFAGWNLVDIQFWVVKTPVLLVKIRVWVKSLSTHWMVELQMESSYGRWWNLHLRGTNYPILIYIIYININININIHIDILINKHSWYKFQGSHRTTFWITEADNLGCWGLGTVGTTRGFRTITSITNSGWFGGTPF